MSRRRNKINEIELQKSSQEQSFEMYIHIFIRDCKIRNLSEHTIKYCKNELYKTLKYFEQNDLTTNPSEMTSGFILEQVILRMMDDNRKETTINATLRALRSFFNYLEKEAFILNNPMTNVKLVRQKRRIIQTFSSEQIHAFLRQPDRSI
ncbi:site-specific integrase [Bacillus sp. JCM 19034]|uniref:site-specific integrase n=1 Tax=Bacillus sp. JCM 19034 TaxID=1481928 RepID=UPI0007803025|nr:site-specific integrase [Bacillus sp. JCM 19034]